MSEETTTGMFALVQGFEMEIMEVPLNSVHLKSELVEEDQTVAVHSSLPIPDVTFILGNDLAGSSVWSCSNVPLTAAADECALKYPDVFSACAITCSMTKSDDTVISDEVDLCDTLFVNPDLTNMSSAAPQEEVDQHLMSAEKVF